MYTLPSRDIVLLYYVQNVWEWEDGVVHCNFFLFSPSDLMMSLWKRAETCCLSFDTLHLNKVLCFDSST